MQIMFRLYVKQIKCEIILICSFKFKIINTVQPFYVYQFCIERLETYIILLLTVTEKPFKILIILPLEIFITD